MIITNNISPELLESIVKEARIHVAYEPNEMLEFVNQYLKDTYNIYIKQRTQDGKPIFYNKLAFYSQCPDYKLARRRDFLKTYGTHFNCVVLPYNLTRHLRNEYNHDFYWVGQVCRIYKAYHIPKFTGGCDSLFFHSQKQYQLFKLKYSEYL